MHPGRLRRRAPAQTLAVNCNMFRRATIAYPSSERRFKAGNIKPLEHFAPHRRRRNPPAGDPQAGQSLRAQLATPAHDAKLIPPPGKQRRHRNEKQSTQRIPLAFPSTPIRHPAKRIPQVSRFTL
jgi:hypothetical protein